LGWNCLSGFRDLRFRDEMVVYQGFCYSAVLTDSRRFSGTCVTLVSRRRLNHEHKAAQDTAWDPGMIDHLTELAALVLLDGERTN